MSESFPKHTSSEVTPEKSNLTPELQAYVRSSEFKAWFGNWQDNPAEASKMLDENGEPQLFFSGRPRGIAALNGDHRDRTGGEEVGYYLTAKYNNARSFASQLRDKVTDEPIPASVYAGFLNIRQPYRVQPGDGVNTARITEKPDYTDGYINDQLQEVVVFDPTQIASVYEQPIDEYGRPV
jgi:hypothetical protein